MENNTGGKRAYLSSLILDLYLSKSLEKVVFSKPADKNEIKSTLTPKNISGKGILQLETFSKDNKAYHKNISDNFESEIYDYDGLSVSLWLDVFNKSSIQSFNYFTNGDISSHNLLIPAYEDKEGCF